MSAVMQLKSFTEHSECFTPLTEVQMCVVINQEILIWYHIGEKIEIDLKTYIHSTIVF